MKRTFLAKRNALISGRGISSGAFVLFFAVLMLFVRLLAPDIFWKVTAPVFQSSDALAAKSHTFFNGFAQAASLAALNEKLTDENTALANENQALLQKVANLSALLGGSASERNMSGILAGVIARPPASPYDTLVLSAGLNEDVTPGMEVFGAGGVPIGIISSLSGDFSRATLFSAPGVVTNGWVGHANVPITITGAGAGVMNAFAARSSLITVGDTVFAPGPGMLPIGSVVRIEDNALSPGMTLRIMPAVNIFSIAWVELRETGIAASVTATSTFP